MREPPSIRSDARGGRDEFARQGVVDTNRLGPSLALALDDDYDVALEGDHHRQDAAKSKRAHNSSTPARSPSGA